jgi:hypothetical protein
MYKIRLSHVRYSDEIECVQASEKRRLLYGTSEARVRNLRSLYEVDGHICVVIRNSRSEVRPSGADRRTAVGKGHPTLLQTQPFISCDMQFEPETSLSARASKAGSKGRCLVCAILDARLTVALHMGRDVDLSSEDGRMI